MDSNVTPQTWNLKPPKHNQSTSRRKKKKKGEMEG